MALNVNSLPDDCLLDIFKRLPLTDLFGLGDVCLRWQAMQQMACRQLTCLTIRVGPSGLHKYGPNEDEFLGKFENTQMQQNTLVLSELTRQTVTLLTQLFEHLSHLAISINVTRPTRIGSTTDAFDDLIAGIRNLRNLTVFMYATFPYRIRRRYWIREPLNEEFRATPYITQMIERINSLSELRKLAFYFFNFHLYDCDHFDIHRIEYDWPIVSQLEELYISTGTNIQPMIQALRLHAGNNNRLRLIELDDQIDFDNFFEFAQIPEQTRNRLPFLRFNDFIPRDYIERFNALFEPYSGLTSLAFIVHDDPSIDKFVPTMNTLANRFPNVTHFEYQFEGNYFFFIPLCNAFQSVRSLTIRIDWRTGGPDHDYFFHENVSIIFPNAESIKIISYQNERYECPDHRGTDVVVLRACAREHCQPYLHFFPRMTEMTVQLNDLQSFTFARADL